MKKPTQKRLNEICSRLDELKNYVKEKEELEKELKGYMENEETLTTKLYEIKYTLFERSSLDTKKLKSENPMIYENYLKTDVSRRFSYKAI